MSYRLTSPFGHIELEQPPKHRIAVLALWILSHVLFVVVPLLYVVAVLLPGFIGFETTVLVLLTLIAIGVQV